MKNIIANLSLVFMMSMALVPSYAENLSEQVADNNRSLAGRYPTAELLSYSRQR